MTLLKRFQLLCSLASPLPLISTTYYECKHSLFNHKLCLLDKWGHKGFSSLKKNPSSFIKNTIIVLYFFLYIFYAAEIVNF